jgi:hypothetical protein
MVVGADEALEFGVERAAGLDGEQPFAALLGLALPDVVALNGLQLHACAQPVLHDLRGQGAGMGLAVGGGGDDAKLGHGRRLHRGSISQA